MRGVVLAGERLDRTGGGGVDPCRDESLVVPVPMAYRRDRALRPRPVVVGHDHPVEELATRRDARERVADPACTNEEDPHGTESIASLLSTQLIPTGLLPSGNGVSTFPPATGNTAHRK